MLMNPNCSLDTIKDCAALSVKLNRIAADYGVITSKLKHHHYLHIYSLVCGAKSYADFTNNLPNRLQPNYLSILEIVKHVIGRNASDNPSLEIDYDANFVAAIVEDLLKIVTYTLSIEDSLDLWKIILTEDGIALNQLEKLKPYLVKSHIYTDALKIIAKIEVVKADFKLMSTESYKRIKNRIYREVVNKKNYMALLQLVFAHKYIPLANRNYTAKVHVADWFNDANEDGKLIRQQVFHMTWIANFNTFTDLKFRFFLNDDADSFKESIGQYGTFTTLMNPIICDEYAEVN